MGMQVSRRALLKQIGFATLLQWAPVAAWPAGETLRFGIMGDRTGKAKPGVYEAAAKQIVTEKPEFILNIGDSIEGRNDATARQEWAEMQAIWRGYGKIPHYFTPGNHDIWSDGSAELYTEITGRQPKYSFSHRSCHVTVLDNSRTNILENDQLDFLRDDLRKHRDSPLKLVSFHRPYWLPFLAVESGEFALHQLCKEHGVKMVLSGHIHRLTHFHRDDVTYVTIGSSGGNIGQEAEPRLAFRKGWFYQYGILEATANGIQLAIQELPGPLGEGQRVPIENWERDHIKGLKG